jgi:hypothetical protein
MRRDLQLCRMYLCDKKNQWCYSNCSISDISFVRYKECPVFVFLVRLWTSSQCFSHVPRSQLGTSSFSNWLKIQPMVNVTWWPFLSHFWPLLDSIVFEAARMVSWWSCHSLVCVTNYVYFGSMEKTCFCSALLIVYIFI